METQAKGLMRLPRPLIWIAFAQILAVVVMPPDVFLSINPVIWGGVAVLFALLGWSLLRRKAWARLASIFVQGFSIIVHLLILLSNARTGRGAALAWDFPLILTSIISMALSAVVLYYIDQPDIHILMQ